MAVVLAGSVLAAGLLASSPESHADVHDDAHEAHHTCAITLASAGFCDTTAALPQLLCRSTIFGLLNTREAEVFWPVPAFWHLPAIGPPGARS